VLGAGLRVVLALGLIGLLAGFLWGIADVPSYTATATLLVSPDGGEVDPAELDRLAGLGETEKVAAKAAAKLGRDVPGADLLSDVTVTPAPARGGLVVRARADAPDVAAAAANGYVAALVDVGGKDLEAGAEAELPDSPSSNRSALLWSAIGLLAGLLIGAALVLAFGFRRRAASEGLAAPVAEPTAGEPEGAPEPEPEPEPEHEPEALPQIAALPLAGPIAARRDDNLRVGPDAGEVLGELLDIAAAGEEDGDVRIAVLGAAPADPAELALGLAVAAAGRGLSVIVVEADLDRPQLAELAAIPAAPGLADYLAGDAGPRDVLRSARTAEGPPVVCLPAGTGSNRPRASLSGGRFESLAGRLPRVYDLVLFTGAAPGKGGGPVAGVADAVLLVAAGPDADERLAEAAREVDADALLGAVRTTPETAQSRAQGGVRRS
jgi:Mrp family chromosome partitioning ATPase